jgi:hypothetical protein
MAVRQTENESEVLAVTPTLTVVDNDDELLVIIAAATLSKHDSQPVSEYIDAIRDAVSDDSLANELVSFVESDLATDVR